VEKLDDLDYIAKRFAEQRHNFDSKRTYAYHGLSYGFPLNELVRRVDPKKRTIGEIVREEINKPLGTEIFIGMKKGERENVLKRWTKYREGNIYYYLFRNLLNGITPNLNFNTTIMEKMGILENIDNLFNEEAFYLHEIGAANGLANADSLAKVAAAMIDGEFNGVRLMSKETARKSIEIWPGESMDVAVGVAINRTVGGFGLFKVGGYKSFGWTGRGGSVIAWDPVREIGFGYVMNAGLPDLIDYSRGWMLLSEIQRLVK